MQGTQFQLIRLKIAIRPFLPEFFETEQGVDQFARFLRTFVDLEIPHIQFNVVRREDLISAKEKPEQYHSLTVRVAGYTAYFTELAEELQDEIIARTSYMMGMLISERKQGRELAGGES